MLSSINHGENQDRDFTAQENFHFTDLLCIMDIATWRIKKNRQKEKV